LQSPDPVARTVGKLCVGGDWACANGDLEALGDIASRLVICTPEPLHRELRRLSELCRTDPDRATGVWVRLKRRVLDSVAGRP
jgi:hypothetical protein